MWAVFWGFSNTSPLTMMGALNAPVAACIERLSSTVRDVGLQFVQIDR